MSYLVIIIALVIIVVLITYRFQEGWDQLSYTMPKTLETSNIQEPDFIELTNPDMTAEELEEGVTAHSEEAPKLARQFKKIVKTSVGKSVSESDAVEATDSEAEKDEPDDEDIDQREEESEVDTSVRAYGQQDAKHHERQRQQQAKSIVQSISRENPHFWSGITQINYYEYPSTMLPKNSLESPAEEEEPEEESNLEMKFSDGKTPSIPGKVEFTIFNQPKPGSGNPNFNALFDPKKWPTVKTV